MELYSFLQAKYKLLYPQNRTVGFRLLTELYSFLPEWYQVIDELLR